MDISSWRGAHGVHDPIEKLVAGWEGASNLVWTLEGLTRPSEYVAYISMGEVAIAQARSRPSYRTDPQRYLWWMIPLLRRAMGSLQSATDSELCSVGLMASVVAALLDAIDDCFFDMSRLDPAPEAIREFSLKIRALVESSRSIH